MGLVWAASGIWSYREDEERNDALEGQGLEDHPELLLVPFEARSRLGLSLGQLGFLSKVFRELSALVFRSDAEIVYSTCSAGEHVLFRTLCGQNAGVAGRMHLN